MTVYTHCGEPMRVWSTGKVECFSCGEWFWACRYCDYTAERNEVSFPQVRSHIELHTGRK